MIKKLANSYPGFWDGTVDGSEIRLFNQLRLVVEIPLFAGF